MSVDSDGGVVYRNAPIVEAIISLNVVLADGGADKAMEAAEKTFGHRFSRSQALQRFNVQVKSEAAKETTGSFSHGPGGWKFTAENDARVLQILPEMFVYSHLQPYTNWSTFSDEARGLWSAYLDAVQPHKVVRIGLRYINRLRLPKEFELNVYLNYFPTAPESFGALRGLVAQVQLPQPGVAQDAVALVTIASEPSPDPTSSAMALDIDIFSVLAMPASDPRVWQTLDDFRVRKNRLFEAAITDKLKEAIR